MTRRLGPSLSIVARLIDQRPMTARLPFGGLMLLQVVLCLQPVFDIVTGFSPAVLKSLVSTTRNVFPPDYPR
jgi:hypothetical protein